MKDQFIMWEELAAWNRLFAMDGEKFSSDRLIQKFKNGKLLQAGSRVAPDQVLWPSVHQAWSKDKVNYSNEYLSY